MNENIQRQKPNFWHGLALGGLVIIIGGLYAGGRFADSNTDLGAVRAELDRQQELVRILRETGARLERDLTSERIAVKDLTRDYHDFLDFASGTIERANKTAGDNIAKLRGAIEALKAIQGRVRDLERFVNRAGVGGDN